MPRREVGAALLDRDGIEIGEALERERARDALHLGAARRRHGKLELHMRDATAVLGDGEDAGRGANDTGVARLELAARLYRLEACATEHQPNLPPCFWQAS